MKKILLIMSLMFILVAFNVSAFSTFWSVDNDYFGYELSLNKWQLLPSTSIMRIDNGGGMSAVMKSEVPKSLDNGFTSIKAQEVSLNSETDIKHAYVYDASNNKYIPLIVNYKQTKEANSPFSDISKYPAIWMYIAPKDASGNLIKYGTRYLWEKFDKTQMPTADTFNIKKGWNFMWVTPDMVGSKLSDWKGNCDITNVASWNNADENKWDIIDPSFFDTNEGSIAEDMVAISLVIKVSNNCKLSVETADVPPAIPN